MTVHLFLGVEIDGNNESVKSQHFGENEDQNHSHEESRLLCCPPHARVAHYAYSVAGRQTTETYCQTSAKMYEAPEKEQNGSILKIYKNPGNCGVILEK